MKKKSILRLVKINCKEYNLFLVIFLLLLLLQVNTGCTGRHDKTIKGRIVLEAEISKYFHWELKEIFSVKDIIKIQYAPFHYITSAPATEVISGEVKYGKVKWIIYSNESLNVYPPFGASIIMKPGDSVHISYLKKIPVYSGTNSQSLALLNELMLTTEKLPKPQKKNSYNAKTLADFIEWDHYLDSVLALQIPIVEAYKDKIPVEEYIYYKGRTVSTTENNRVNAFTALSDSVQKGYPGLSSSDLNAIWDSTQYKPWRKWLQTITAYYGSVNDYYSYNRMEVWRRFGFDFKNDSLHDKEIRTYLYYTTAKNNYQGLVRERLMAFILDESTITEMGIKSSMTQTLLKDYYSQPGFPEYKAWVKKLEEKQRAK